MNTYIDHSGNSLTVDRTCSRLSQDLYADLVAAIHIGRALEAKCERLEAMLDNAGDLAHNLQDRCDYLNDQLVVTQGENDDLRAQVLRLRAELDRLELVS